MSASGWTTRRAGADVPDLSKIIDALFRTVLFGSNLLERHFRRYGLRFERGRLYTRFETHFSNANRGNF